MQKMANVRRLATASVSDSRTGATFSPQPQPASDRCLRSASAKPTASLSKQQVRSFAFTTGWIMCHISKDKGGRKLGPLLSVCMSQPVFLSVCLQTSQWPSFR